MEKKILDVCCGSRMFWFDKNCEEAIFLDIRSEEHIFPDRIVKIKPDIIGDFRCLPFNDNIFKLVVFDPPHLKRAGRDSWLKAKYGILSDNWEEDLYKGFLECFRVLEPFGVLVFKWNEDQIKVSDILKLVSTPPLFGHTTGRHGKTHWITFMKKDI